MFTDLPCWPSAGDWHVSLQVYLEKANCTTIDNLVPHCTIGVMNTVNISYARQHLPELVNRVFGGEEFVIVKNNIPVARVSKVSPGMIQKKKKKRMVTGAFGMWKDLKGSTVDIVNKWREEAWRGRYDG